MRTTAYLIGIIALTKLVGCTTAEPPPPSSRSISLSMMQTKYHEAEKRLPVNLLKHVENLYLQPVWKDEGGFYYSVKQGGDYGFFQYDNTTHQTSPATPPSPTEKGTHALTSPNGTWEIRVIEHNLMLVNTDENKETMLTRDGTETFPYATENPNPKIFFNKKANEVEPAKAGYWSPDSRYFVTFQLDLRNVGKLHLLQSVPGNTLRPKVYQYHYPMAGDRHLIEGHLVVVDTHLGKVKRIKTPPVLQTYYGTPLIGYFAANNRYYFLERERGNHTYYLKEYNPESEAVRTVITERNNKFIDPWIQNFHIISEHDKVLWTSERNGIQQVFAYRLSTGKLLNAVSPDTLFMRAIKAVNVEQQQLYFEGSGAYGPDPYFRYLYRVNLDGSGLTLLTSEHAMHNTHIAPDFSLVVDSYSTVTSTTRHVVRNIDNGNIVHVLHEVDDTSLREHGYRPPKPFTVIAEDGITPLHGVLYFPSHFNPNKRYPIIDDIYTGPHGYFTPKTFDGPLYSHANALAELGFIVLKMDGRGTGKRDRKFHEYSYENLAGGADDHVWVIKNLAEKYTYIDSNRVGIYGFSAGGYDTVHAMLKYPDFFKVGVAASGNHDFRADKAGWNETWMNFPVTEKWDNQSNLSLAARLTGKLLLAHGELDDNVHPAATLQLANALINANKDFELMIYPNMGHVLEKHPYFVRKRWDFFVEHLLKESPPPTYTIDSMPIPTNNSLKQ